MGAARKISFGVLEQIINSGSNFLFLAIISHALGLKNFGIYNIAWSSFMLAEGITSSVFGDTGAALINEVAETERSKFYGAHILGSMSLTFGILLVACAGSIFFPAYRTAIIASSLAIVPLRVQQAIRRFCYWRGQRLTALAAAIIFSVCLIGGSLFGWIISWNSPAFPIIINIFAFSASAVYLFFRFRREISFPDSSMTLWCLKHCFGSGRWLIVATLLYWFNAMGVIWLAFWAAGARGGADMRILLVLFNPLSQFGVMAQTFILPIISREMNLAFRNRAKIVLYPVAMFSAVAILYVIIVTILGGGIINVFFPLSVGIGTLWLGLAGIGSALDMIETSVTIPQIAVNHTSTFMFARVSSAVALILSSLALIPAWSFTGLLLSILIANLVQLGVASLGLFKICIFKTKETLNLF